MAACPAVGEVQPASTSVDMQGSQDAKDTLWTPSAFMLDFNRDITVMQSLIVLCMGSALELRPAQGPSDRSFQLEGCR